jgi:integrase
MSLTDTEIKAAKPKEKPYKLSDGEGLYLLINPNGSRWWRYKYGYGGKEKLLALGTYAPRTAKHVTLAEARNQLADAKRLLRDGIDPSAARKAEKEARRDRETGSFELVAREWHAKQSPRWSQGYADKELRQLTLHVFPRVGSRPMRELTSRDLLDVLQRIEARGRSETAHRVRRSLGAICRYAVATHRANGDASAALKGALAPVPVNHFASITDPKRVGRLIRDLRGYDGSEATRIALQLAPLLFVRPGELRAARWDEFVFDLEEPAPGEKLRHPEPEWRIPATRMKMGEQHIVPLSKQAVVLLRELHARTGPDGYVFPSIRSNARPMSENTINAALRGLGYTKEQMTGHGFRHMARTLLHERGYRSEWVERQLAHGDRNAIRARYNFAEHLPERRKMMQEWADYLDALAKGADVIPIRSNTKA